MPRTRRSPRNRHGQGLVEYALVLALIGCGLTAALVGLRNSVGNSYNSTAERIGQATGCAYAAVGVACASEPDGGSAGGGTDGTGGQSGNGGGNGNGNGNNGNNGNGNNGNGGGNGNGNNGNGNGNGGGRK